MCVCGCVRVCKCGKKCLSGVRKRFCSCVFVCACLWVCVSILFEWCAVEVCVRVCALEEPFVC